VSLRPRTFWRQLYNHDGSRISHTLAQQQEHLSAYRYVGHARDYDNVEHS
jgi:hypothetical protein